SSQCKWSILQNELLLETGQRVRYAARCRPSDIRGRSVVWHRWWWNQPAVDHSFENRFAVVWRNCRLAILWHEGVEIDEMLDLVPRAVGTSRRDHAAVGMADENDIAQILELKRCQNILNMGFKIDVTMREMGAFAEASVCRSKHFVSPRGHEGPQLFPRPA